MKEHSYHLEKYHGRSSRHECPDCHDPHSFTYYVDEDGVAIDKSVGRCDHESRCGYHYSPKQYFQDHRWENEDDRKKDGWHNNRDKPKQQESEVAINIPTFIDRNVVLRSLSFDSTFVEFLCGIFPPSIIKRVVGDYAIGATKDRSVVFWQIDANGHVRTGKVIKYDPDTGHRRKDLKVDWVHAILKRKGMIGNDYHLKQCLFGEHLLKRHPERLVALVEAEKTAVIGSGVFPNYVWVATGGKSQLPIDKLRVLTGRNVLMFPDVDGYQEWCKKAKTFTFARFMVSDLLEKNATQEEREGKIDIADWVISSLERNPHRLWTPIDKATIMLYDMEKRNPAIGLLVEKLDLEVCCEEV